MADEPDQSALSLEQIEQDFWGDAPADASRLIRAAHELRRKPVHALTAEDLRLLISQEIGVEALVPQAIALLRRNPLVEGDYYPGDLLVAVMKLPSAYWDAHRDELNAVHEVVRSVENPDSQLQDDIDRFLSRTVNLARDQRALATRLEYGIQGQESDAEPWDERANRCPALQACRP